jgi:hypothetical protein
MAQLVIEVQKRRDKIYEITVRDSVGVVVNLTGASAKLSIRLEENEPTVIKTYSTTPSGSEGTINITDPTGGKLQVLFDDTDFAAQVIPKGKTGVEWRWDLLVVTSAGTRLDSRNASDYVHRFLLKTSITD